MKQMLTDAHLSSENTGKVFPPLSPLSPPSFNIIYCYSIKKATHKGLVKIGQTTTQNLSKTGDKKVVADRIKSQTNTSGIGATVLWYMRAGCLPGKSEQTTDHDLHRYFKRVFKIRPHQFKGNVTATEWFKLGAADAKIKTRSFLKNGYPGTHFANGNVRPIVLRKEQEDFVKDSLAAYQRGDLHRLWFAKMRFGKTLTAYSLLKKILEQRPNQKIPFKVVIITHRPVVDESWYEEYCKVFGQKGGVKIQFSSNSHGTPWDEVNKNESFIRFISMQDLRGKEGGGWKEKNKELFGITFDIVIIDESHEGNATELAVAAHENLKRGFTLHLSGTPFRQMATGDFSETQINSFDYIEEQKSKTNWNDKDGANPYAGQPKLWINTLNMTKDFKEDYFADGAEDAMFDFNTLWKVNGGKFENPDDIRQLLSNITSTVKAVSNPKREINFMPFSEERREHLLHTLWVLPSVDACEQLKLLLKQHNVFKEYKVINVAGEKEKTPLETVKAAIAKRGDKGKTITLTVGKLTTGVTVPEWTGVLMLRNTSSIEFYLQTIFRVQSAWSKEGFIKTDCFVWDFAPDRALKVFTKLANPSAETGHPVSPEERKRLEEFLNYMPVITVADNNQLERFEVDKVYQEIKRIYQERVVNSGFDSNLILTSDTKNLSAEVLEAIQRVNSANGGKASDVRNTPLVIPISGSGDGVLEGKKPSLPAGNGPKRGQTQEEKEAAKLLAIEKKKQDAIRNVLKTISVRIPYMIMALMSDATFKNNKLVRNFKLGELADGIDEESWKEFFGAIDKETFKRLEPAFDEHVLQISVLAWIEKVEKALTLLEAGEVDEYTKVIKAIMGKIKNPNKETVLTPYEVVGLVHEASELGIDSKEWDKIVAVQIKTETNNPVTFYDINAKTGLFPLYAAHELFKAYQRAKYGITWQQVVEKHIYANTRTKAAGWVTETILGLSATYKQAENSTPSVRVHHENMTVIDASALLKALEANKPRKSKDGVAISNYSIVATTLMLSNKGYFNNKGANLDLNAWKTICQVLDNTLVGVIEEADILKTQELRELVMEKIKTMGKNGFKFDYVISNPPYQETLVSSTGKARPIWDDFVRIAVEIGKQITIINPARWQKGGQGTGLSEIKNWFLTSGHLKKFINIETQHVFPTASISGGVCIQVIDTTKKYPYQLFGNWTPEKKWSQPREYRVSKNIDIPLDSKDENLVEKIMSNILGLNFEKLLWVGGLDQKTKKIASVTLSAPGGRDWGITGPRLHRDTDYFILEEKKDSSVEYIKVYYNESGKHKVRYLPKDELQDTPKNRERLPQWKILFPRTGGSFIYRNFGPIGAPDSFCTNTWICRSFGSRLEVENFSSYMKTYFYRYLLCKRIVGRDALANLHRFVPDLVDVKNPRTGKVGYESDWTDDDLRILYRDVLTDDDWRYMKAQALAIDGGRGDYEAGWVFPDGSTRHSLSL